MKIEDESHASRQNGISGGSPESPCLKSCASSNPNNNSNNNNNNNHHHHNKEQDKFLPIANVGRIMKKVIPLNGKISKDAKEILQECVSEFISFVTGEASDKCQREKRKTINGDDIIWAITTLGFEDYVSPLKVYLEKYREIEGDQKVNNPKQQRSTTLHHHQQQQQPRNNQDLLQEHNLPLISSVVYSTSPNFVSQPPFITADPKFPLS